MPPLRTPGGNNTDIPVFSAWRQHDDLAEFASILREHDQGIFFRSAMLVDELFTDDRIQGVTETRIGELLSSPLKFEPPSDKRKALKVAEEIGGEDLNGYGGIWESICSPATAAFLLKFMIYLGIGVAEIAWERTPEKWTPRLVPWHPANVWWSQWERRFILNTQEGPVSLPRPDEQPNGDGKWVVLCPYGVQYGWRDGIVRSMGEIYLSRRYAKRDFNRWTETRALGILKGKTPQKATPEEKDTFRSDLANAHSETVVIVPQGADGEQGYDVEGVSLDGAGGTSWQGIKGLIDDTNTDIAVLILGGNLPTEQKGTGSYASSQVQKQTSVNRALRDASLGPAIGRQVLTHFADANYGDALLAPMPCYEVTPEEDELKEAQAEAAEALALKTKAEAIGLFKALDPHVDVEAMVEAEGLPVLTDEELAAKQAEEAQRRADLAAEAAANDPARAASPDAAAGGDQPAPEDQPAGNPPARAALAMLENVRSRKKFQGLDIAIENPANTIRPWTDEAGRVGHTRMQHDYGFIEGVVGADKEELDVYLGNYEAADHVYVIRQHGPVGMNGRWCYDEDKCFLGFASAEDAKAAFLAHRDDGDRAFGGMVVLTLAQFRAKLNRRRATSATTRIAAAADPGRALVALAVRARAKPARTVAGGKRSAKYQEALQQRLVRNAQAAMRPDLAAIREEVAAVRAKHGGTAAVTPEVAAEVKRRLLKRFSGADPEALARVLTVGNVMSNLSGRASALEEI